MALVDCLLLFLRKLYVNYTCPKFCSKGRKKNKSFQNRNIKERGTQNISVISNIYVYIDDHIVTPEFQQSLVF